MRTSPSRCGSLLCWALARGEGLAALAAAHTLAMITSAPHSLRTRCSELLPAPPARPQVPPRRIKRSVKLLDCVPSRSEQLRRLGQHGSASNPYDVLIIGGGATGTGCAVDAATRWVCSWPWRRAAPFALAACMHAWNAWLVSGGPMERAPMIKNMVEQQQQLC